MHDICCPSLPDQGRRARWHPIPRLPALLAVFPGLWVGVAWAQALAPGALLKTAIGSVCKFPQADAQDIARLLPGSAAGTHTPISFRNQVIGWRRRFTMPDQSEIEIQRIAPGGRLRRISAEYRRTTASALRPELFAIAGGDCRVRLGRRLVYDKRTGGATMLQHLDRELRPTGVNEPVNPPIPAGTDPGGLAVAIVDAGVNYLLPAINARLARDSKGKILGYDFWDLDERPFDANPARSVFFPQRHGTRIASIVLREAPGTRLVPYRYPRPDMSRMAKLVDDAAAKDVFVINLSLGSSKREDWEKFAEAARAHSDMLFVVSAGNNGRDIDQQPVYPAALALANLITVTSAEATGELAQGSNSGAQAVDLLVPGENMEVTGFDGRPIRVSGSSYAAARITALAARLLLQNPDWRAPQLKTAIFARALKPADGDPVYVAQGFIPDPAEAEQRPVTQRNTVLQPLEHHALSMDALYPKGVRGRRFTHAVRPTFAFLAGTSWNLERLRGIGARAAGILAQCGILVPTVDVVRVDGPETFRYYRVSTAKELVRRVPLPKPTVYFLRDTLRRDAYDAEAIGKGNSNTRPTLIYTVWMTQDIADPGIGLAHELIHILADSGEHVERPRNVMRTDTAPDNVELTSSQCEQIINTGEKNGLLHPLSSSASSQPPPLPADVPQKWRR